MKKKRRSEMVHVRDPYMVDVQNIRYTDGHFELRFNEGNVDLVKGVIVHLNRDCIPSIIGALGKVLENEERAVKSLRESFQPPEAAR